MFQRTRQAVLKLGKPRRFLHITRYVRRIDEKKENDKSFS